MATSAICGLGEETKKRITGDEMTANPTKFRHFLLWSLLFLSK
jgi:hypothetical protein